jgi:hypothetical protein
VINIKDVLNINASHVIPATAFQKSNPSVIIVETCVVVICIIPVWGMSKELEVYLIRKKLALKV